MTYSPYYDESNAENAQAELDGIKHDKEEFKIKASNFIASLDVSNENKTQFLSEVDDALLNLFHDKEMELEDLQIESISALGAHGYDV